MIVTGIMSSLEIENLIFSLQEIDTILPRCLNMLNIFLTRSWLHTIEIFKFHLYLVYVESSRGKKGA